MSGYSPRRPRKLGPPPMGGSSLPAGPYAIGSDHWPGLSKLTEECGEVGVELADFALARSLGRIGQVAGKILGSGGDVNHFDGSNLKLRMEDELADLEAAIEFFKAKNDLDRLRMLVRSGDKLVIFSGWHEGAK